jgi:methionine-rich copper-binding protein CopC
VQASLKLASVVAGVVAALAAVLVAFAHAEPEEVAPGADAVVTEPPAEVVILMSQEVVRGEGTGIDVVDEGGIEVTTLDAVVDNGNRKRVSVLLPDALEPGEYTVRWRTASAEDGDSESGEYSFTYDPNGVPDPGRTVLRESPLDPAATETATGAPVVIGGGGGGTSWVLVAAVGVGMLAVGSGVTFLLVQKRG